MNSSKRITETNDRKVILSTLWIFVLFNYLYADFLTMVLNPVAMTNMAKRMTEGVMLGWVVLMETAIAMIVLSRILKYRANRWANIIVGVVQTAAVAWTLLGGVPRLYYMVFAAVEIACTVFIVWYAWTWRPQDAPVGS
ncbi:MAG: DUF6326 family protein [Candidatus Aminicenantales bacterium]